MSYKIITYENFVKVLNETIHSLNVGTLCEFYDIYIQNKYENYTWQSDGLCLKIGLKFVLFFFGPATTLLRKP